MTNHVLVTEDIALRQLIDLRILFLPYCKKFSVSAFDTNY